MTIVHFAVSENGSVRPLCGEWGDSKNWTSIRDAVTCPRCLERLQHEREQCPAALADGQAPGCVGPRAAEAAR